jgi:hypothetical protein
MVQLISTQKSIEKLKSLSLSLISSRSKIIQFLKDAYQLDGNELLRSENSKKDQDNQDLPSVGRKVR